jgi:hypothetical protein
LQSIRLQGSAQLYSSQALLEELTEVLTRDTATRRLQRIGKSAQELIADYVEAIEFIEPTESVRIARDPKDDRCSPARPQLQSTSSSQVIGTCSLSVPSAAFVSSARALPWPN